MEILTHDKLTIVVKCTPDFLQCEHTIHLQLGGVSQCTSRSFKLCCITPLMYFEWRYNLLMLDGLTMVEKRNPDASQWSWKFYVTITCAWIAPLTVTQLIIALQHTLCINCCVLHMINVCESVNIPLNNILNCQGCSTFFQQLVARAYTTVENILAQTLYPLVLTLT